MEWVKSKTTKVPVKSWCKDVDPKAMEQAENLANHPVVYKHVALMPDCHGGYGMPIGGVIGCENALIPNAVGVDIGCGMGAVETNLKDHNFKDMAHIRSLMELVKKRVPVGEGHYHDEKQEWTGFDICLESLDLLEPPTEPLDGIPGWMTYRGWELDQHNLGTLGGGNHFIELQKDDQGNIWLMLHSGSRNLGYRVASYYHKLALSLNEQWKSFLPDRELAFLPINSPEGQGYLRDMNYALAYALENRRRMMDAFKQAVAILFPGVSFIREINIHHNYAALENHFGKNLWVHRKGATSAKEEEWGIIPGSMGTSSYIVKGKGNPESFMSCSHGAGRKMGRNAASRNLTLEECDQAMDGVVFDRWNKVTIKNKEGERGRFWDFGESPLAYKDIDEVIKAELDLIEPMVKLHPLGVIKG